MNADILIIIKQFEPSIPIELLNRSADKHYRRLLKKNIAVIERWYAERPLLDHKQCDVNDIPKNQFIRMILKQLKDNDRMTKIFITLPEFISYFCGNPLLMRTAERLVTCEYRKISDIINYLIRFQYVISNRHIARCIMILHHIIQ